MKKLLTCLLCFMIPVSTAYATDLMDIYHQALENDPVFKAAFSQYMSTGQTIAQARSALLPQLSANAQAGRNYAQAAPSFKAAFNSKQWQVNASQAIFNYQAWSKIQQAKATVKAAEAAYYDAAEDLMLRTSRAYFDVLLAKDTLNFAEAKMRANKRQLEQAEERFKVGLDAITSVYEAKAAYDQSVAEVISAKNNQINQSENLRKLTNHVYETLSPLRNSRIPLIRPEPDNVNEWTDTGLKQNFKLYSAKYSLEAARDNIKAQASGSWPTLSVQGMATQTRSDVADNTFFVPSRQANANFGLSLNFPVFQGGLVTANTRQAQYDFQTSSEELEKIYRDVVVNSRIAFNNIIDGISKVKADRQTVISRINSLESTEAQFQVGTRTMVDVVNAQQRLFESQLELATDQYNLIYSYLFIKYMAGSLNANDLEEVNSWLSTTRIAGEAPSSPAVPCCK